jgi:CheY-like chemotaxis protein
MSGEGHRPVTAGGPGAGDLPRPPDEVLEVRPAGTTTGRIPGGERLLRVLVVDDCREVADLFSILMKVWGHDVRVAYDGTAALETIAAYRPDVLLLEVAMPDLDSCRLARQLRRHAPVKGTLLIAVTGGGDERRRRLCAEAGFDHYLFKPVVPSTLKNLLLLQQHRLAESPGPAPAVSRACGILVVDDEAGVRGVLDAGLRQRGFTVWLADSGREALQLYRRHRGAIDVVLLDVRMPDLDGPQTLAALRELHPHVRCCFMSGDPCSHTAEGLRDLGAAAVLPKPFRLDEVAQVLRDVVSDGPYRTAN